MRKAVLIGTVLAAAVAGGCGGDDEPADPTTRAPLARGSSLAPSAAGAPAADRRSFKRRTTALMASLVAQLAKRSSASDEKYYDKGIWHSGFDCWRCDLAPGVIAAILARSRPGEGRYRKLAIGTFDRVLDDHQQPDGSFGPPPSSETGNNHITTMVVANYLGVAYLELRSKLGERRRERWRTALERAARWLEPKASFYVNGNINLGVTNAMYLAYRATGRNELRRAFDRSWAFTLDPQGERWKGFGLRYLKRPKRADGSDGAGYLAEQGAGEPGFDPHYTTVQAGYAAMLFALSRKERPLRLLNLLTNAILTRTKRRTLVMQTGEGSRHPAASERYLEVPAIPVAALTGGRTDLLTLVEPQLQHVRLSFPSYVASDSDQSGTLADYATALIALDPP